MGDWSDATPPPTTRDPKLELIRLVLQVQRSFYESWGRWPTVADIADLIGLSR